MNLDISWTPGLFITTAREWSRDLKCIHQLFYVAAWRVLEATMQSIVSHKSNFDFGCSCDSTMPISQQIQHLLQKLQPFQSSYFPVFPCPAQSACMLPHGAPTFSFKTFSRLLKPSARQYLRHSQAVARYKLTHVRWCLGVAATTNQICKLTHVPWCLGVAATTNQILMIFP